MSKRLLSKYLAILAVFGLLLSACTNSAVNQQGGGDIHLGCQTPLSAPGAVALGQNVLRGAELGVEYVNTVMGGVLGGRKFVLDVEDDRGQNETAIAAYRRLVTEKNAVFSFCHVHSSALLAVNEVAKEIGVPTMGTMSSAKDVTAKGYNIAFRHHIIDPAKAEVWLKLIQERGWKRIAMIAEDTDYGIGLAADFRTAIADQGVTGLTLRTFTVDRTAVDLTPQLLQVRDFNPDVFINITTGTQWHQVQDQAGTIGLFPGKPIMQAGNEPTASNYWQLHPNNGVGLLFMAYYHPQQPLSDAGQWLDTEYRKKFNEAPIYESFNGFGQAVVIAQAIERAKSTEPAKIIEALETGSFKTWTAVEASFPKANGVNWHNWSPPILILEYTQANQDWRQSPIRASSR